MENIYLGVKGITSTSANYLANLAKETIKEAESKLENLTFVNKSVELINGDKKSLIVGSSTTEELEPLLIQIANMHSFCAWIREAIRFKEMILENVENLSAQEYSKIKGIEYPDRPKNPEPITEEDVISEMNIKERNNYFRLEAFASTFGKYIHPGGTIANARENLLLRLKVPNEVDGRGRDMVIYSYTSSCDSNDVNAKFLALQNKYREYEKQINAIKHQIKKEVNKRNAILKREYKQKHQEYSQLTTQITTELSLYQNEERERIANLKIVIPEKLQDTYEYLESLGK